MYMHTYALYGYTCRYGAIHVNQPGGISQAAAVAANHTQGVKISLFDLSKVKKYKSILVGLKTAIHVYIDLKLFKPLNFL